MNDPAGKTCPVCDGATALSMSALYDDRYGYPGTYDLVKCRSCGHESLAASFTDAELGRLYTDFYPRRELDPERWAPHRPMSRFQSYLAGARSNAFRWVPEKVSVLDVGCGFAQALGYHRDRGCDVAGVEVDENARRIAEKEGLDIRIGVFSDHMFPADRFDYVTLDQVIEHVQHPRVTMESVRHVLKPGGYAILATPNSNGLLRKIFGRRWVHWHTPYHLQFFTRRSMKALAKQAGLRLESRHTVTTTEWTRYQWIHLVTRPRRGEASLFWMHRPYSGRTKQWSRFLLLVHLAGLNHVLTRCLDMFGLGDNQIFILRRDA